METAKDKLLKRLAGTPDADLERFEAVMADAIPLEFRQTETTRLEAVGMAPARIRQEILDLSEADAQEMLDYFDWIDGECETLSDDELAEVRKGEAEIA